MNIYKLPLHYIWSIQRADSSTMYTTPSVVIPNPGPEECGIRSDKSDKSDKPGLGKHCFTENIYRNTACEMHSHHTQYLIMN